MHRHTASREGGLHAHLPAHGVRVHFRAHVGTQVCKCTRMCTLLYSTVCTHMYTHRTSTYKAGICAPTESWQQRRHTPEKTEREITHMQMRAEIHAPTNLLPTGADTHRKLTSMCTSTAAHHRHCLTAELNSSSAGPTPGVPTPPSRDSQARRSAPGPREETSHSLGTPHSLKKAPLLGA